MRSAAVLCLILLSGCAGTGGDCGPDWYALGQRDGRMNFGSQADRYASRCGAQVDRPRYEEGYQDGFSQRPRPMV